jgi:hypothetical protein
LSGCPDRDCITFRSPLYHFLRSPLETRDTPGTLSTIPSMTRLTPLQPRPLAGSNEWSSGASTGDGKPNRLETNAPVKPCRSFGGIGFRAHAEMAGVRRSDTRRCDLSAELRHTNSVCRTGARNTYGRGSLSQPNSTPMLASHFSIQPASCCPAPRRLGRAFSPLGARRSGLHVNRDGFGGTNGRLITSRGIVHGPAVTGVQRNQGRLATPV